MTKPFIAPITSLILSISATSIALAQSSASMPAPPANQAEVEARFKAADKNGDGKVTREEAEQGLPRVAMAWEKIDVDKKGYITLDQLLIIAARNQ